MKFLSILVIVLTCDYIDFYKLAILQDKKLVKLMLVKINVLTCDYIDFHKLAISQDKKTCETDVGQKSMYSHVSTLTFVRHM